MKILIIDNDTNTVTTLQALISSREPAEIEVAYGGKEGLEKMAADSSYDLVNLGIMIAGGRGLYGC